MTRNELRAAVDKAKAENKEVLETMYNGLSKTQKGKMHNNEKVQRAFKRHGMKHEE